MKPGDLMTVKNLSVRINHPYGPHHSYDGVIEIISLHRIGPIIIIVLLELLNPPAGFRTNLAYTRMGNLKEQFTREER